MCKMGATVPGSKRGFVGLDYEFLHKQSNRIDIIYYLF